jgi:CubicO group peptidase (beta-lactamase class C family)
MTHPAHLSRRQAVAGIGAAFAHALAPAAPAGEIRRALTAAADAADIPRLLRLTGTPSLSMATVDGRRVTATTYGVRRTGEADPATPDTVYAAASLTKPVFAYLLLGLIVDGRLTLDRPVREYLPLPNPDDGRAQRLTIRHLLSHSGGWRNWRFAPTPPLSADFEPGTRFAYSGEGFFFLQRLLETVSGKAMGTLAREQLFAPLGMSRSSMLPMPSLNAVAASPHNARGEPGAGAPSPMLVELQRTMQARGQTLEDALTSDAEAAMKVTDPSRAALPVAMSPNAAASMMTTANDYGRFVQHLLSARRARGRVTEIVRLMLTPQVRLNDDLQWGLGIGLEARNGRQLAWQWGDNPGFKNFLLLDPARDWGMVLFSNGDRGARVYERVVRDVTQYELASLLWT